MWVIAKNAYLERNKKAVNIQYIHIDRPVLNTGPRTQVISAHSLYLHVNEPAYKGKVTSITKYSDTERSTTGCIMQCTVYEVSRLLTGHPAYLQECS